MNNTVAILRKNLPELKKKYPLQSLGIFGSVARSEENGDSDVDILYEALPDKFLNLDNYISLKNDLRKLIKQQIDLVNKKFMNEVVWLSAKEDIIYV